MWKSVAGATVSAFGITVLMGIVGMLTGKFVIASLEFYWNIPDGVSDVKNFLIAGTMHTFSYFGGLLGLVIGIVYQIRLKKTVV